MAGSTSRELTLLFADIEGSTALLTHLGVDGYAETLAAYRRIVRTAIAEHRGSELGTEGDSFFVVFDDARDAVAAALAAQLRLTAASEVAETPVRVRMGVHTGQVTALGDGYVGLALHQAARIAAAAHGGQTVVSDTTRAAAPQSGATTWRSLGRHRLKDLTAPAELFQLVHPGLEHAFPPLRSLERVAHNLPVQPSTFVGRADELRTGSERLEQTRVLTITGSGGTGKTRLAYQLAAERLDDHPDGVWVCELASLTDPSLVPTALRVALGLRDEPGRDATDTVVSHLRHRAALVVLDNCEHVVDAAAQLVDALARGCPHLRVVVTSREPLRVGGETVWAIEPLGVPPATSDEFGVVAECDSVTLFHARAAASDPEFRLTPQNILTVGRICRRVDGLPLAIELAAARVRTVPLDRIAERLDRDLGMLAQGGRATAAHQANLRATVAWSYDLLDATEQQLFTRIGVFVGGLDVDAATAICGQDGVSSDEVADVLDALAEKSLIRLARDGGGSGRYRLLETIRMYAAELLTNSPDAPTTASRHADHFATLARELSDVGRRPQNMARLTADHPNLLAAVDHLARGDDAVAHGTMLRDLLDFWEVRGEWRLARLALLRYLDRADRDDALAGECAAGVGRLEVDLCEYGSALAWYDEAERIARELGDPRAECTALTGLGTVATARGESDRAAELFERAADLARDAGDARAEARTARQLGLVNQYRGRWADARLLYEQVLGSARELGDRRLEMVVEGNLGTLFGVLGDFETSRTHLEAGLALAREIGDPRAEALDIANLGNIALALGDYDEARRLTSDALHTVRALGDRTTESKLVGNLAFIALQRHEFDVARGHAEDGIRIARDIGDRSTEARSIGDVGEVALAIGDLAEARSRFALALETARSAGDRPFEARALELLATVALAEGHCSDATANLVAAQAIARDVGDRRLIADCQVGALFAALDAGEMQRAGDALIAMLDEHGDQTPARTWLAAAAACLPHDPVTAATLLAAADHGSVGRHAVRVADRRRYEQLRTAATSVLGGDAFATAYESAAPADAAQRTRAALVSA